MSFWIQKNDSYDNSGQQQLANSGNGQKSPKKPENDRTDKRFLSAA